VTLSGRIPVSLLAEPHAVRPSFDALIERVVRNFTGLGIPKSERPEGLTCEAILTPDEAVRGVRVPISIPCVHSCPFAAAPVGSGSFPARPAGSRGSPRPRKSSRVPIPPPVRPGSIIEVPLYGLGIHNLYLRGYWQGQVDRDRGRPRLWCALPASGAVGGLRERRRQGEVRA
jgi:molecular chaperone DnaJ